MHARRHVVRAARTLSLPEVAFDYVSSGSGSAGAAAMEQTEFESLMSSAQTFYEDGRPKRARDLTAQVGPGPVCR